MFCQLLTRPLCLAAILLFSLCLPYCASAQTTLGRLKSTGILRVCIWPDYHGVSFRNPQTGRLEGVDIELSAELARDLKLRLQYVDSSFSTLVDDLQGERCDIAMFAVAMLPQRTARLKFSHPYLQSDIFAVTTQSNRLVRDWADIDRPGVLVGVQAGSFMETVLRADLHRATLVVIAPPATREQELQAGRIDVFMTDYPYSRHLVQDASWARLIVPPTPYHVLPYGYAIKPGDEAWLTTVNKFVERIQVDGRLRRAAAHHGLEPIMIAR